MLGAMRPPSYRVRIESRKGPDVVVELTETEAKIPVQKVRSLLFAFALVYEAPGSPKSPEADDFDDSTERIHAEKIAGDIVRFERLELAPGPPARARFQLTVRDPSMVAHLAPELTWPSNLEDLFVR
jgi:hypothetical protein